MRPPELRKLWQATFGRRQPGWVQRDFLVRALAYHFQEKAYGGLNAVTKRQLLEYAKGVALKGAVGLQAKPKIKPGTRLVREWGGATHVINVLETEFEYGGKHFASLSEIARAITNTRWSGPAFFGLTKPMASSAKGRGKRS